MFAMVRLCSCDVNPPYPALQRTHFHCSMEFEFIRYRNVFSYRSVFFLCTCFFTAELINLTSLTPPTTRLASNNLGKFFLCGPSRCVVQLNKI
jgi:hypothetical protein